MTILYSDYMSSEHIKTVLGLIDSRISLCKAGTINELTRSESLFAMTQLFDLRMTILEELVLTEEYQLRKNAEKHIVEQRKNLAAEWTVNTTPPLT
jgi:hypothetical protein